MHHSTNDTSIRIAHTKQLFQSTELTSSFMTITVCSWYTSKITYALDIFHSMPAPSVTRHRHILSHLSHSWGWKFGTKTLRQACSWACPRGAMCVRNFDDSRDFAIRMMYRISLRFSSLWEPRHSLLKVVCNLQFYSLSISSFFPDSCWSQPSFLQGKLGGWRPRPMRSLLLHE